jgi:hypothetical protein
LRGRAHGEVVDALATAASWSTWDTLRTEWGNDRAQACAVLARMVRSLLAEATGEVDARG